MSSMEGIEAGLEDSPTGIIAELKELGLLTGAEGVPEAGPTLTVPGSFESSQGADGGYLAIPTHLDQEEFFDELLSMDQEQRKEFERELFVMGFYNRSVDIDTITSSNTMMPDSLLAAERFFTWAATAGDGKTPWFQLSRETAEQMMLGGADDGSGGAGGGQGARVIQLQDSEGLTQGLRETYRRIVGKVPTQAEERAFVAAIHGQQRAQQNAIYEARAKAQSETMEVEGVDAGAQAEAFAREQRPLEAGGMEAVQQTDVLRSMTQRQP